MNARALVTKLARRRPTRQERFWAKVMPEPMSGCWLWIGALSPRRHGSYGVFKKLGALTSHSAHTFAYEMLRGPVPSGLELDHVCRNTQCVNPAHLEAVTRRINLLRSRNVVALNERKTTCPKGHAYDAENTGRVRTRSGIQRFCRRCNRTAACAYQRAKRAERKRLAGGGPLGV